MTSAAFIALGALAAVGGVAVFTVMAVRRRPQLRLVGTVLLAFGVLALVSGWLLTDEKASRGDALKTGGLAAGSVVALYALWLNDRRRQVDEGRQELDRMRQELESRRAEHDRQRAADERFLRAVELLGNDADQVRVGALHALAGLARARPQYTQDVLDVICSYLRRPFDHPDYASVRGASDDHLPGRRDMDRWRQVRSAAQRLIADLLPTVDTPNAPTYNLDLHGATLEYFDISRRVVGQLRLRAANLYESNSLHHCEIHGSAWFTGATSWGRLHAQDVEFHQRSWFSQFSAYQPVDFSRTVFHGDTKFARGIYRAPVSFRDATFDRAADFTEAGFENDLDLRVTGTLLAPGMTVSPAHEVHLPPGWLVDEQGQLHA
jgi:hypothetical protein